MLLASASLLTPEIEALLAATTGSSSAKVKLEALSGNHSVGRIDPSPVVSYGCDILSDHVLDHA